MTLKELIEQAQRFDAEATKGPWEVGVGYIETKSTDDDISYKHRWIMDLDGEPCSFYGGCGGHSPVWTNGEPNRAFIAASRSLLPELAGKAEEMVGVFRASCYCNIMNATERNPNAPRGECKFCRWLRANGYGERPHGEEEQ